MAASTVARLAALFAGNPSYYISCNTKRAKDKQNITQHKQYTDAIIEAHLAGGLGIGICPLLSDSTCNFAAIDIDTQNDDAEVDFADIARRIDTASLPVVMCRTRSGGAHLYLFLKRPTPAKLVRELIIKWADQLDIDGTDCFLPSADVQPVEEDGKPRITRSINLPYHNAADTVRYAFAADGTTKLSLDEFLNLAEAKRVDPNLLMSIEGDPCEQAPPCVQRLIIDGIPKGMRNESMMQIALYLKRVDPKDVLPRAYALNDRVCDPPMGMDELRKIVKSVSRRGYLYRCKVEPCKSLCNSAVCLTRKHGIKPSENNVIDQENALADLPPIDDMARVQQTVDGGVYRLRINGHSFTAPIKQLVSIRDAQVLFAEHLGLILPAKLGYAAWYEYIMQRVITARIDIQAEEDTDHGALRAQLDEFIAGRLKTPDANEEPMKQRARLDTAPILEGAEVIFRMSTFMRYCRDRRINLPQHSFHIAALLRKTGAVPARLRTPMGVVGVWKLPHLPDNHNQTFSDIQPAAGTNDY